MKIVYQKHQGRTAVHSVSMKMHVFLVLLPHNKIVENILYIIVTVTFLLFD